jgi:hypothetical protein
MNTYLRTSKEFQPLYVDVTANGITTRVTNGVQYVVVPKGTPLSSGEAATPAVLQGEIGFYTDQLTVGYWDVGVRVSASPEAPFLPCGTIRIK